MSGPIELTAQREMWPGRHAVEVLGIPVDVVGYGAAQDRVVEWGLARESRYVVLANVHVVVTASRDVQFGSVVAAADMATPDGAPIAWMLRRLGASEQRRVSGPDLTWSLLQRCERVGLPVYFYGSTPETLQLLMTRVCDAFPGLKVAGFESPPFRALTEKEDADAVLRINNSGAGLVFVGLGCPKQEYWMLNHRGRVRAVMLGVGAAFDFHAGTVPRAPSWMRSNGLEWLHRLASEPRRLWQRYLVTNSIFLARAFWQLMTHR